MADNSFLSFNFDNKNIEEFNLFIISGGDRFTMPSYPEFSDQTTSVPGRIGQQYWSTNIETNSLELNLMTGKISDGSVDTHMTARQYENFKRHFSVNKIAKLTLSQAPYKYCWAKISSSPQFSLIPFEGQEIINGKTCSTVVYRGEGSISFVLFDPLWYGIDGGANAAYFNYNLTSGGTTPPQWALESGIPFLNSFSNLTNPLVLIANNYKFQNNAFSSNSAGLTSSLPTSQSAAIYILNAGSFEAYPIMTFTFTPKIIQPAGTPWYYSFPYNEKTNPQYNTIRLQHSGVNLDFRFSLPRIMYSIQNAFTIVDKYTNVYVQKDALIADFRDSLDHAIVREHAIGYARALASNSPTTLKNNIASIIRNIGNTAYNPITVSFDSKTSISKLTMNLTLNRFNATMDKYEINWNENAADMVIGPYLSIPGGSGIQTNATITGLGQLWLNNAGEILSAFKMDFKNTYIQ